MARPTKAEGEKRDKRLTIYLTEGEERALNAYSEAIGTDKAKIVVKATIDAIEKAADIPEPVRVNKTSPIARRDGCTVRGFVCDYGHAFFLPSEYGTFPDHCPRCGTSKISVMWAGEVSRGFK